MASNGYKESGEGNDPQRVSGAPPSSATGMFSAVGTPAAGDVSEEDFFAQFRNAPEAAAVVVAAPVVAAPVVEAPVPSSAGAVARPVAPKVREVFIRKPAQTPGRVESAAVEAAAPVVERKRPGEVTSFLMAMGAVEASPSLEPEVVPSTMPGGARVQEAAGPVAVSESVVAAESPVAGSGVEPVGGFTQMFRLSELPLAEAVVPVAPAAPEVVAEESPVAEVAAPAPAVEVREETPSFTQMLKAITEQRPAVEEQKAGPASPTLAASPAGPPAASPVSPTAAPWAAPVRASEPVKVANINEILERLNRPKTAATVVPPPLLPPQGPPAESVAAKLQAFRASVAAENRPAEPALPAGAKAEPGSFTQFMAGAAAPAAAASVPAAAVTPAPPVPVKPEARAEAPVSFTQFMSGVPGTAAGQVPSKPAPPIEASPQAGGGAGSFTQMMASLGPAPVAAQPPLVAAATPVVAPVAQAAAPIAVPVPPPQAPAPQAPAAGQARPGSMTQLLQSLDRPREAGTGSGSWPAAAANRPAAPVPSTAAKDGSGFTQFFQSPLASPRREAERGPFEAPGGGSFGAPAGGGAAPGMQGGGSFTQMMQALNQPQAGAKEPPLHEPGPLFPAAAPSASFPSPPAAGMGGPGSFTQLMQTLDGPTAAAPARQAPAPPANAGMPGGATSIFATPAAAAPVVPPASGPSDYTRIISGSALRDARAKAPGMPAQPPAPIVPGAMQMPAFAMPGAPPPMPPPPQMAMPQMQMPGMAMPQMAPPIPPVPAPPKSKMQQYLPLIIIANVLLVVVIVVIVVFVLRAHK